MLKFPSIFHANSLYRSFILFSIILELDFRVSFFIHTNQNIFRQLLNRLI